MRNSYETFSLNATCVANYTSSMLDTVMTTPHFIDPLLNKSFIITITQCAFLYICTLFYKILKVELDDLGYIHY
jgi:hypothetical protein